VEVADAFQDAARKVVSAAPDEEGRNTVLGLKIPNGDINFAVRERASVYWSRGRLLETLFLMEHAFDKESGKISYLNDPALVLDIARVYCGLKRYREAMNYFYRLVEARPELWLIQESLGNLSVLGTVDQVGRTGQQN
jgi:tetratricopeptide (TPR) repeat protein